ncbi:MAG TPA: single-stranded DNA-binding protein [Acidimicrobiales bacterium]|nr:single-stranded DNA-binding protein [Acidimicrobiales bacterium]
MSTAPVPVGTNLALLLGTLRRPPELRPLPGGDAVLTLELAVHPEGAPTETVPVAWYGPSDEAVGWSVGEELLVAGRTRQRFFRSGGATQSRTEVVAKAAVPTRRAAAARKAVAAALAEVCPEA